MIRTVIVIIALGVGIASGQTTKSDAATKPDAAKRPTTADPKTRECRQDIGLWSAFGEGDFALFKGEDLAQSTSIMTDCIDHARLTPAEFRTAFHVYDRAIAEFDSRMQSKAHEAQEKAVNDPLTQTCRARTAEWSSSFLTNMGSSANSYTDAPYTDNELMAIVQSAVSCFDANLTPTDFRIAFHAYAGAMAISHNRFVSKTVNEEKTDLDGWQKADDENARLVKDYNSLVHKYNSLLGYAQGLAFSRQFVPATSIHCTSNTIGIYTYTDCH